MTQLKIYFSHVRKKQKETIRTKMSKTNDERDESLPF